MDVKIVISVFISTILVAAIYSSSTYFVSAEPYSFCSAGPSPNVVRCQTHFEGDKEWGDVYDCVKNPDGKTWNCSKAKTKIVTEGSVPPELGDALDLAIQQSPNPTKDPKTGLLDEPGALSGDEYTENGNDTAAKKKGAIGNPEYGDITDLNNDAKPSKDLGDLQNEDDEDDGPTINPDLP